MPATVCDVKVECGSTFELTVDVRRGIPQTDQVNNMVAAEMQIRPYAGSPIVYTDKDELGGIYLHNDGGQVQITIPGTETETYDWFEGAEYDVRVWLDTGYPYRIVQGRVQLSPQVTRS
jgi:hypothetical protein